MKKLENSFKNQENQPGTMKNHENALENHDNQLTFVKTITSKHDINVRGVPPATLQKEKAILTKRMGHSCKIGNASDLTGQNRKLMLGMCSTHGCV